MCHLKLLERVERPVGFLDGHQSDNLDGGSESHDDEKSLYLYKNNKILLLL